MTDFKTSVTSGQPNPFDHVKVQTSVTTEKQKVKEDRKNHLYQKKKSSKFASILSFFSEKLLHLFPKKASEESLLIIEQDLDKLEVSLRHLCESDLSQDAEFLQELSHHWLKLLDDFFPMSLSKNAIIMPLKDFLDDINSYPPDQEFSLGYYLSEYAGLEWIPFPYMDLLKKLHAEHKKSPDNSKIQQWINEIEKIIQYE